MNWINDVLDYFFAEGPPVDPVWDQRSAAHPTHAHRTSYFPPFTLPRVHRWTVLPFACVCCAPCRTSMLGCRPATLDAVPSSVGEKAHVSTHFSSSLFILPALPLLSLSREERTGSAAIPAGIAVVLLLVLLIIVIFYPCKCAL